MMAFPYKNLFIILIFIHVESFTFINFIIKYTKKSVIRRFFITKKMPSQVNCVFHMEF